MPNIYATDYRKRAVLALEKDGWEHNWLMSCRAMACIGDYLICQTEIIYISRRQKLQVNL